MALRICTVSSTLISTTVFCGVAVAQEKSSETPLKPVTVCEILANPQQFNGRAVAALGRFDYTDEGEWLSEDDCGAKLVTGGYTWPNIIWLDCCYETAPDHLQGALVVDDSALNEKLQEVRKTTQLKYQKRIVFFVKPQKTGAISEWRDVKDQWAVVYGRLETRQDLQPPTGSGPYRDWGNGFGHLGAAPVQLVIKQKNILRFADDSPPKPNEK